MTPSAKPSGVVPATDAAPRRATRSRAGSRRRPSAQEHIGPAERAAIGKTARGRLPLESHAEFVTTGRSDPSSSWRARRSRACPSCSYPSAKGGCSPHPSLSTGAARW